MYPRVSLLLAYALLTNAECVQVGEIKYGAIEVIASNLLGDRIDSAMPELIESGSRKSVKSAFRSGVARTESISCVCRHLGSTRLSSPFAFSNPNW